MAGDHAQVWSSASSLSGAENVIRSLHEAYRQAGRNAAGDGHALTYLTKLRCIVSATSEGMHGG